MKSKPLSLEKNNRGEKGLWRQIDSVLFAKVCDKKEKRVRGEFFFIFWHGSKSEVFG